MTGADGAGGDSAGWAPQCATGHYFAETMDHEHEDAAAGKEVRGFSHSSGRMLPGTQTIRAPQSDERALAGHLRMRHTLAWGRFPHLHARAVQKGVGVFVASREARRL